MKNKSPFINNIDLSDLLPEDEYSKKILNQRTILYAVKDENVSSRLSNQYVLFKIGSNQLYGINFLNVTQIERMNSITPLPNVKDYIVGVHYWHGKIIPIISLATFLKFSNEHHSKNPYVAVITINDCIVGIIFDEVLGMGCYNIDKLQPQIAEMTEVDSRYIEGIHNGKICILNTNNIVSDIANSLMNERGGAK